MVEQKSQPIPDVRRVILILGVMVSGGFITMLNQTVLTPALPHIMADTGVTANTAQWLTTIFLLVAAVMIPVTAFLINRFTTRQLFIIAMLSFCVGSLLCAVSRSFAVVLVGRVFQACGAGVMMPLCQTATLLLVPMERRGTAMGLIGLVMALAPAIGPTLSGWVIDVYNWHIMFYAIALLSMVDIVLAFFVLQNVGETGHPHLDMVSVVYSTIGLAAFLYGCSSAGDRGLLHPLTLLTLAAGIAVLLLFVRRQLAMEEPFLDLRILAYREFMIATVIVMILNATLICGSVLMPIFMQNIQGLSAMESGLVMLPGAVFMGIINVLSGHIFDKQGPRRLALLGIGMLTVSSCCFMRLGPGSPFAWISFIYTLRMVGLSMAMMPITTWGLNTLSNRLIPHGTAINNTLRQVAGSLGTTLFVAVMTIFAATRADEGYIASNLFGLHMAFALIAAFCAAAWVLAIIFVREPVKYGTLRRTAR